MKGGLLFSITLFALVQGTSTVAFAQARFGTFCQEGFQSGWRPTLDHTWNLCGKFNDELDDTDIKVFYWSLEGTAWNFTDSGDQAAIETVDLLFIATHSGAWFEGTTQTQGTQIGVGTYAMWNQNQRGFTNDLYLGDEGVGLEILANYSCELLKTSDGLQWNRWNRAFKGGLKYVTGSHDKLFFGLATNESGKDFADLMQGGNQIKYAWKDGVTDWANDQDASVMASGCTQAECIHRRDTMKWQNFGPGYETLRDGNVAVLCGSAWDNL